MLPSERKPVLLLASVFGLRLFGMFLILPVLALHLNSYPDATELTLGLALGAYGLSQAVFQLPFGVASDRFGRKPLIAFGLGLMVLGSVVGCYAETMTGVIIARTLQGAGAIGSTILALVADITRVEVRTRAMAMVGGVIGLGFGLAMVVAPALDAAMGLSGIFALTGILGVLALLVVQLRISEPVQLTETAPLTLLERLKLGLMEPRLWRIHGGILALHAVMTALFTVLPLQLRDALHLAPNQTSALYLSTMAMGFVFCFPAVLYSERRSMGRSAMIGGVATIGLSTLFIALTAETDIWALSFSLMFFFAGFTLLEALLPSAISKMVSPEAKGTVMGVFSTAQFLGIFLGGACAGWANHAYGVDAVYGFSEILVVVWLLSLIGWPKTALRPAEQSLSS